MQLPVIDLSAGVEATAPQLARACSEVGFFYLVGHGVSEALQRELEAASAAFFALPGEQKAEIAMARGGPAWRGWFPVGAELTSGVPDRKEGLYFGVEIAADDPRAGLPLHGPNLFPRQVPALRHAVLRYMAALEDVGHCVMRGVAASLGLDPLHFERDLTREPLCLFRVFHYPPAPAGDASWGVGEHTDYGLLTLLKQDTCGGLQVKAPDGWIDAPPIENAFVCNLGDMLDRMTGGRYRSTPHRVRNTSGRDRYSYPFFFDPGFGAEVRPLPGALARPAQQDAAERWDRASVHDFHGTYGEYLIAKVAKVFPQLRAPVLERSGGRG